MASNQSVDADRAEVVEETRARVGIGVRSAVEIGRRVIAFEVRGALIGDQVPLLMFVDGLNESTCRKVSISDVCKLSLTLESY